MAHDADRRRPTYQRRLMRSIVALVGAAALIGPALYVVHLLIGRVIPPLYLISIGVLMVLLLSGAGGLLVSQHFAQPVKDLRDQADRFAAGDYSVEFEVEDATREIADMADSLNAITRSTRTAMAELKTEEQRQRQFVSDVSHEIRTPLTGIRGNAETMLDPDMPPEMRERFIGIIIGECDRLTRLANDLLELSRIEAAVKLDLKRIDLHDLATSVIDMLTPLMEDRGMQVTLSGEAPDVLGDEDKLKQVLMNLLENASRFAHGRIHVELAGIRGQSVITVTDDGDGFGDTDPSRLFDRFYRADKSRASATGGTGLGLAIVKSIVSAHDGSVEAFNIPNGGACFAVGIPSIAPREAAPGPIVGAITR